MTGVADPRESPEGTLVEGTDGTPVVGSPNSPSDGAAVACEPPSKVGSPTLGGVDPDRPSIAGANEGAGSVPPNVGHTTGSGVGIALEETGVTVGLVVANSNCSSLAVTETARIRMLTPCFIMLFVQKRIYACVFFCWEWKRMGIDTNTPRAFVHESIVSKSIETENNSQTRSNDDERI
mmetsp:Transcript_1213/g.1764  ORF Transcript_1213/g.1764 Transcript_1213/m.1764 type:complete len:179 (-) Transcript_1213:106-642(-)